LGFCETPRAFRSKKVRASWRGEQVLLSASKNLQNPVWCIYTIPLEPILSKIPDGLCRAAGAAQNRNGSRAKNFLP